MYTCEVVLKTARETGESVGIIGKSGKCGGKLGENWGMNCETEFPDGKIDSPHSGEKGGK